MRNLAIKDADYTKIVDWLSADDSACNEDMMARITNNLKMLNSASDDVSTCKNPCGNELARKILLESHDIISLGHLTTRCFTELDEEKSATNIDGSFRLGFLTETQMFATSVLTSVKIMQLNMGGVFKTPKQSIKFMASIPVSDVIYDVIQRDPDSFTDTMVTHIPSGTFVYMFNAPFFVYGKEYLAEESDIENEEFLRRNIADAVPSFTSAYMLCVMQLIDMMSQG